MTEQSSNMKARGADAAPRKYSWQSWTKGYIALVLVSPIWLTCWILAHFKLSERMTRKLLQWHFYQTVNRPHDVRIPSFGPAYMLRWWKIKRNAFFNIYLHQIYRSDDDTAHHDHPWWNFSIVLDGGYYEHWYDGDTLRSKWFGPGSMHFRWRGRKSHRLVLQSRFIRADDIRNNRTDSCIKETPATTIFITGPVLRRWGFIHRIHDKVIAWVDAYDWDEYCAAHGLKGHKMEGYEAQLKGPNQ